MYNTTYLGKKGQKKNCTNNLSGYLLSIHFSICIHPNVSNNDNEENKRWKKTRKKGEPEKSLSNRLLHSRKKALLLVRGLFHKRALHIHLIDLDPPNLYFFFCCCCFQFHFFFSSFIFPYKCAMKV